MPEELDKDEVVRLLAEADIEWYRCHSGELDYLPHLLFVANYTAQNYCKKASGNLMPWR